MVQFNNPLKKAIALLFTVLILHFFCQGQSIVNLIQDCQYISGNVASTSAEILDHSPKDGLIKSSYVQTFDNKNRLVSAVTYNNWEKEIEKLTYFYSKRKLVKVEYAALGVEKHFYYQYQKRIPRCILTTNANKDLQSISNIFLDSLKRPTLLESYDLNKQLLFSQLVQYDEQTDKILVQVKEGKQTASVTEYQLCAEDIYLESINLEQFENIDTKILNLKVENKLATIVKAVNLPKENKEEIHIQEIAFDEAGNWVKSSLYRLKKRKQKKILIQEINRTIVYR